MMSKPDKMGQEWAKNGIVPRSLEKEDNAHEVSWKPFIGALRVKARPGKLDQHLEASLAR